MFPATSVRGTAAFFGLRISSFCFSPADSGDARRSSATRNGIRSMTASSRGIPRFQSITAGASAREISRFSTAVWHRTSVNC